MKGSATFPPSSEPFRWTAQRERAAVLLAENDLSDAEIASAVGVHFSTLWRWRQHSEFAARVGDHIGQLQASMLRHAIAKRHRRLSVLNDLHNKLLTVVAERAAEHADEAPGGGTGLMVRQTKVVGYGKEQEIVYEWAVDAGLVREIRAIHEQAAKELGQWIERSEVSELTHTVEIVGVDSDAI